MAKSISTQSVKFTADTSNYEKGTRRAAGITKKFGEELKSTSKLVAGIGIGLAAAFVTGTIAAGVATYKEQSAAIDELAKSSDRLGVSTESLQAWRHAAGLAGGSGEMLNDALKDFTKNVGEAQQGAQGQIDKFAKLGISQEELNSLGTEELFKRTTDAISQQESATLKAASANQLFGGSGAKLINLFNGGSAALDSARSELEQWGGALTRVDAAKVEAANDAISRVSEALSIVGQKFTVELAPYVEATAKKLLDLGFNGGTAAKAIVSGLEYVAKGIAVAADVIVGLKSAFHGAQAAALYAFGGIQQATASMVGGVIEGIQKILEVTGQGRSQLLDDIAEGQQLLADNLLADAADKLKQSQDEMDAAIRGDAGNKVLSVFKDIKDGATEAAQKIADAAAQQRDLNKAADDFNAASEVATAGQKTIDDLKKQIENFGLSAAEVKIKELIESGASKDQVAEAKKLADQLDALQGKDKTTPEQKALQSSSPVGAQALEVGSASALLQLQKNAAQNTDTTAERIAQRAEKQRDNMADTFKQGFNQLVSAYLGGAGGEVNIVS